MTEIRYVKDLIKYLADFNPNAEIVENIDIGWAAPDCEGERDIESEKLNTPQYNYVETVKMCNNMRGVCVDFDGVLNNYEYYDDDDLSTPRAGAREFLESLSKRFYVIIFTVRDNSKVEKWLNDHNMPYNEVTNIKKPAVAYIDDRALQFNGDYKAILNVIESFEPYYLRPKQGYDKTYRDYLQMKIDTYDKHNDVINDVKDWFETYQPQITLKSIYLNPRPMIDQLCLILDEKLPAKVINSFCNEFMLDISSEWYRITRRHNYSSRNEHKDYEEWRYSFKVRI